MEKKKYMLWVLAVSSALVYILALSCVFGNCSCHTVILFGTSHFFWNYQSFACQWHHSTTVLLALWALCEDARQSTALEGNTRIMSGALVCSLTRYFLKIHLVLIDHQSQLGGGALWKALKTVRAYETDIMQPRRRKSHTVTLLYHPKLMTLCSYIKSYWSCCKC